MNSDSSVTSEVGQEIEQETNFFLDTLRDIDWQGLIVSSIITLIKIILIIIAIYIGYRIAKYSLKILFQRYRDKNGKLPSRYRTIFNISENILVGITWFLILYTALSLVGIPVGTLLAGAGVIGLAVSLGAQDFVSDLINGFSFIIEERMNVGDHVILENIEGIVVNIKITTTIVRDFDGVMHYIPNSEIIIISNRSRSDLRVLIQIPLFPETNLDLVREAMNHANERLVETFSEITTPPDGVSFVPYENGQIAAQVIMFTEPEEYYTIRNQAYEWHYEELAEAGVDLPDFVFFTNNQK